MARVTTVVVPKPEFDALVDEVERLRDEVAFLRGKDGLALRELARANKAEAENETLRAEKMGLLGRLSAMADHHDAEHEKCARRALKRGGE